MDNREKVYECFNSPQQGHHRHESFMHHGTARHHHVRGRHSALRKECKPPIHNTLFENLCKDSVIEKARKYKHHFIMETYNEITNQIYSNAEKGITQFITTEFPLSCGCEEPNIFSKLSDEDVKRIEHDFREKGFDIKSRMDLGKKSVRFVIKSY